MTVDQKLFVEMRKAVLDGDDSLAAQLAERALAGGVTALIAIDEGLIPGLREAGDLWEEGEYFLPELVSSAQAMQAAMKVLEPALEDRGAIAAQGRVVIGTVQGDIHDIGKRLVGTLLAANGFDVIDEGADVSIAAFVARAKEVDADIVCASALLTTTMAAQGELVTALRAEGLRALVMVGGAPVTAEWAEQIGADGYADSAVAAVSVAQGLMASDAA